MELSKIKVNGVKISYCFKVIRHTDEAQNKALNYPFLVFDSVQSPCFIVLSYKGTLADIDRQPLDSFC